MRGRRIRTLALLMVLLPAPLLAQGGGAAQRIQAAEQRAQAAGVPAALLQSKVAEGRAKGVPMERIALAVEQRTEALIRARLALRLDRPTPAELTVGADALAAGVGPEVLRSLSGSAPADRRAVAIAVLTQLVQGGERPEQALEHVRQAMERGPEALRQLPAQAVMRRQGPPAAVGRGGQGQGRGVSAGGGPPAGVPATRPGEKGKPGKGKPGGE